MPFGYCPLFSCCYLVVAAKQATRRCPLAYPALAPFSPSASANTLRMPTSSSRSFASEERRACPDEEIFFSMTQLCELVQAAKVGVAFGGGATLCEGFDTWNELNGCNPPSRRSVDPSRAPSISARDTNLNPCQTITSQLPSDFCNSDGGDDVVALCEQYVNQYQVAGSNETQTIGTSCSGLPPPMTANITSMVKPMCSLYNIFTTQAANCRRLTNGDLEKAAVSLCWLFPVVVSMLLAALST